TRICCQDSGNIFPDGHVARVETKRADRGRVVRAFPSEGGCTMLIIGTDESLSNDKMMILQRWFYCFLKKPAGLIPVDAALTKGAVGADDLPRILPHQV